MAKQTFTTGAVLTAAQMTSLQQTALGGGDTTAKTASYVLVAADAGTTVAMNAADATTITVNTGLFAAGDTVFIQNRGAGVCTVTAGTATVACAGSLALPQNDAGILYFTSASAAIFYDWIQVGATSPLTTKGDLYGYSTSDQRIPIGANATVLTADSTEALGLKWAAPAGSFVGCIVKKGQGSTQSIANNTLTAITWNEEDFDTDNFHSTSSNTSRFTVPSGKAGKYQLVLHGNIEQDSVGRRAVRLYKNGESFQRGVTFTPTSGDGIGIQYFDYSAVMNLAVADYIEVYFFQNNGNNLTWYAESNSACAFYYLGA